MSSKSPQISTRRSLNNVQLCGLGGSARHRFGPEFSADDIIWISELGRGNGGVVSKTQHKSTGFLMSRKTFEFDIKTSVRAQILRDLQILWECSSPFVLDFYGAFYVDDTISICMEYMDAGGLDTLLPIVGRFPEPVIIHIASSVVQGLMYLWQELHIMHRNLKPSNILVNRGGFVKLCDFVVSLQLAEALASAFIGMRTYMAPERLTGEPFGSPSDIWSLGLTLMELAIGRYPIPAVDPVDFVRTFAPDLESNMVEHWRAARTGEPLPALEGGTLNEHMSIFELFVYVVEHPAPRLPAYCFSSGFIRLVHSCLQKEPEYRLSIQLLHSHILPDLLANTLDPATGGADTPISCYTGSASTDALTSPSSISVRDYLHGVFMHQQKEAVNAVALAVGEDLDAADGILSDQYICPWSLPSTDSTLKPQVEPAVDAF